MRFLRISLIDVLDFESTGYTVLYFLTSNICDAKGNI